MRLIPLAVLAALTTAAAAQTGTQPQNQSPASTPGQTAQIAAQPVSPVHLIPLPRQITFQGDQPLTGITIVCPNCNSDDQFAAGDLRDTLAKRGVPSGNGLRIVLQRLGLHPDATFTDEMKPEGYTITYTSGVLTLTGATSAGVFYAAQTAKQMIEREPGGSFILQAADIHDWPAMHYRGLSDDLSRGPTDTLAFQEKIVRILAEYKDNLYSPYFEHTQQYLSNPLFAPPGGSISPADARALVAYATKYHVMVVPEQEAFGHIHHAFLEEEYQPLAETPFGAVLAPGAPGALNVIKDMFTELAALYPSPFLHVGGDETFDLGRGQTKAAVDAQGLGTVYLNFMQQIDNTLRPLNRKLLFWGDIAEKSPELLKTVPDSFKQDMIAISWHYGLSSTGYTKYLNYFKSAGFEFWVAPGISNWSRVYPDYNVGLQNIQQFTRDGQAAGATGQLNTIWYDDGQALAANNWYGILFGCAAAWQPGESSIVQFQSDYGPVFHGDMTGKLNVAQQEIMSAQDVLKYDAQVGDASDSLFWEDPWSKEGQQDAAKLRPYLRELRLDAERALDLIAQARASYPPAPALPEALSSRPESSPGAPSAPELGAPSSPWLRGSGAEAKVGLEDGNTLDPRYLLPSDPTSLREPNAIDALELGARRIDFIGLKFELSDQIATDYATALSDSTSTDPQTRRDVTHEFGEINNRVEGRLRDIRDRYALYRDLYSQLWLRTNRPYSLRPVQQQFDSVSSLWLSRMDKVHDAQLQWSETRTLPAAADLGIPPAPPAPNAPATPMTMAPAQTAAPTTTQPAQPPAAAHP